MTNEQLIHEHLQAFGFDFEYDGTNLMTFQQWKRNGMSVIKGQTAFVKLDLWTFKEVDCKDENGKVIMEDGKPKKEKKFFLKAAALFHPEQVQPMKEPKPKKKKAAAKKKKAA